MKKRKYKDLDDLFYNLNREMVLNADEMIDFQSSTMGLVDNLYIKVKSSKCTLDLSQFGYAIGKWRHLIKTYINYEELQNFNTKLQKSSSFSLTYNFNQKKVNNGSCLIAIVLSRRNRKAKWDKVNVLYRTTELQRRFAADLVLIHHFIKQLPECCDIKEISFFMPICYSSSKYINAYLDYFDIDVNKLSDENSWVRGLIKANKNFFSKDSPEAKFQTLKKLQDFKKGKLKLESINIDDLSIKEVFEGGK